MNKEQAIEKIKADVMNILKEHSTFVDGQIKGLIVHGAIEKIAEYIAGRTASIDELEYWKKRCGAAEGRLHFMIYDSKNDAFDNAIYLQHTNNHQQLLNK